VGAIVVAASLGAGAAAGFRFGNLLGLAAVVLAMVNVAGGFVVTHRMLEMFQPKKK
jgi:NAD(P) transhydrogenase subunit alpha